MNLPNNPISKLLQTGRWYNNRELEFVGLFCGFSWVIWNNKPIEAKFLKMVGSMRA